jgi:hypothetical protein
MNSSNNRRSEFRTHKQASIFVEVCSASFDNNTPANVILCNSIDLSANGMQIEMDKTVAIGSILRIGVEFSNNQPALYLVGEAKWVKPEGDVFNIGFEIYDAENTDIAGWKEAIASLLEK